MIYIAKKITLLEKLKRFISKNYRTEHEKRQNEIIREMLTTGKDAPIYWD